MIKYFSQAFGQSRRFDFIYIMHSLMRLINSSLNRNVPNACIRIHHTIYLGEIS